jgi:hypothetical protein
MAERNVQQKRAARGELRRFVGFSVADEIGKLDQLKRTGSITDDEFAPSREAGAIAGVFPSPHRCGDIAPPEEAASWLQVMPDLGAERIVSHASSTGENRCNHWPCQRFAGDA